MTISQRAPLGGHSPQRSVQRDGGNELTSSAGFATRVVDHDLLDPTDGSIGAQGWMDRRCDVSNQLGVERRDEQAHEELASMASNCRQSAAGSTLNDVANRVAPSGRARLRRPESPGAP